MRERFEQRIETGLQAIVRRCEQKRGDLGVIERRIGRRLGKNTRAARLFSVQVGRDESGRVVVTWSRKASVLESAKRREGLLPAAKQRLGLDGRGSLEGRHATDGSRGRLPDPEGRVATATGWPQTAERVQAHIPVCFLADVLRKTLKEVWVEDRRYVVCLNDDEARKDAADREAIVAALREQLRSGDKSLVGNKGYRRYLGSSGPEHFRIDEAKVAEDARYDGMWVLRTNTDWESSEVALQYKRLWTVEQWFRSCKSLPAS